MTAKKALATVLVWTLTFACLGMLLGAVLGATVPQYYRSVFPNGDLPTFNPLQVGIGLGAAQGTILGAVLSVIVLALLAWRDNRAPRSVPGKDDATGARRPRSWTVHALWCVVAAVAVLIVGTVAFFLGGILGQEQLYQSWTQRKLDKLATIIASEEFADLETGYSSAAQVYLTGTVNDDDTHEALRDRLVTAFGTDEAEAILSSVEIAP
jgi:ABC-type Fe3+ transport system permease subunit